MDHQVTGGKCNTDKKKIIRDAEIIYTRKSKAYTEKKDGQIKSVRKTRKDRHRPTETESAIEHRDRLIHKRQRR